MTKQEFEVCNEQYMEWAERQGMLECLAVKVPAVTEEEYREIEHVYTFYPTISEICGKHQISQVYMAFGMAIIRDMTPRANKMMELEKLQQRLKGQLRDIEDHISDIRNGGDL